MKQLYLLLLFGFVFTDQYGQDVTRYTPTGIPVYAIDYLEWASEEEIAAANVLWQDSVINANNQPATCNLSLYLIS